MFGLFRRTASVGRATRTARTDGGFVPRVEPLEGRTVPANIPVGAGDVPGLIAAITEANGNGEADTIDIAGGTFTLTAVDNETNGANGLPVIGPDGGNGLTINGNGAVIERSADELTPDFRILEIDNGESPLTITGVTIRNGLNPGADGGGILLDGGANLTLIDSTVTENVGEGAGGGIAAEGGTSLTLVNSRVTGNTADGPGGGIAVYANYEARGTLNVRNSTIADNESGYNGGGIYLYSTDATLVDTTISGNHAALTGGGAFAYDSALDVRSSTISGNVVYGYGGGLALVYGSSTVANTTIADNTAIYGSGGGVALYSGERTFVNTTTAGNTAGQVGGGLFLTGEAVVEVQNSIVSGNADLFGANDVYRDEPALLNASNSLFQAILYGTINGTDTDNIVGLDPLLGPLQDNGGPTRTMALLPGSPATDTGSTALAEQAELAFDQRGSPFVRAFGLATDIGAFERQPYATATVLTSSVNPSAQGQPVTFTATVTPTTGGAVTPIGIVSFYDGATLLGSIGEFDGVAVLTTSALVPGSHTITAVFTGSPDFASSTSNAVVQVVQAAPVPPEQQVATATFLNGGPNPVPRGQPVTFTAAVVSPTDGAPAPVGTVNFFDGTTLLGSAPVVNSVAALTTSALARGTHTITAVFVPGPGFVGSTSNPLTQVVFVIDDVAVGAGPGGAAQVKVFDRGGTASLSVGAYPGFGGAVRVDLGDVTGDDRAELITGAGAGAPGGHVKVFDRATGAELRSFLAFPGFSGGVFVAAGDVNNDGFADIIVGAGAGATGGHVKVFSGRDGAELLSFFAFPGYLGGVTVGAGDVDGDGRADVVVGTSALASHVKVFSGQDGSELRSFFAFPGFGGGVNVAAGDLDGDGKAEVITGAGPGGFGHVKAFDGASGNLTHSFLAFSSPPDGVTVAAGNLDGDVRDDLVLGAGPGAIGARVRVLSGLTLLELSNFVAFDDFNGGVFVGS